mmetsp:Transcript_126268/g.365514  ORF Transcript_126268/g.365514 Transcript_126268/m.365514 type:complete len:394 (+) Transcript_126268:49-1230(+)
MASLAGFIFIVFGYLGITSEAAFSSPSPSSCHNVVEVQIARDLSGITSIEQAKNAWKDYVFEKGGGVPAVVLSDSGNESRLLLPLGAREDLVQSGNDDEIQYQLTELGLWKYDLIPDSHLGSVKFEQEEAKSTVTMKWSVSFRAKNRLWLWREVSQSMVSLASDNLVAYLATPRLFTRTTYMKGSSPEDIAKEWVDFFVKGGGLPINQPVLLPSDGQMDVASILRIPPFLRESILSVSDNEIIYKVMNPGIWTAYPVHSHLGRIRFVPTDEDNKFRMLWEVEVRPMRGATFIVETFTDMVISTLSRNFKVHLEDPGGKVPMKLPPNMIGDEEKVIAHFSKDSWLGGVLEAYSNDDRKAWERLLSAIQPWTWGRNISWDEKGEGANWETAHMEQ